MAPINSGERGLQLRNLDDMWRFAKYACTSGLTPKGVTTPEAAVIALQCGFELGMGPMASLQSIAVINNRPTLFGDAMLAVCRSSGFFDDGAFEESHRGSGDETHNACTVRRLGASKAITRTFSIADAKKASLWGKQGPWSQYPKRMLQMRARSWALRDAFPDVLKGIYCAEEVIDIPPSRPVPSGGSRVESLAARLSAPVPDPPYDPPTEAEQAEAAPGQPSFTDAAGDAEPQAESQVNPDVDAAEGKDDEVATDAQILETECMEMVAGAVDTEYLDSFDAGVKTDKRLPAAAKKRLLKASKERRAELTAK